MALAPEFTSSFQGPWGTCTYALTHFLKKCIPGLLTDGSRKSTRVSTKFTCHDSGSPPGLGCYRLLCLQCCAPAAWPASVASEGISMLFYASPTQLLLFYSGLAIWQGQLSKVVLLRNNTALKIPYFTLAPSHIFDIVLDAYSSTTMPEGTCVLTPFLVQGCGE